MRILQVNTFHYRRGGDCVHALTLADALRDKGHEVRFFGMNHPLNLASDDAEYWLPYLDFAELNGRKSPGAAMKVLGRTLYSPVAAQRIREMVATWRPDVAHLHSVHGHLSLSVLVELNRLGVPVVWTLHDYKLLCPNTHLLLNGQPCELCRDRRYRHCVANRCKKDSAAASAVAMLEAEVDRMIDPARRVARFIAPSRFLLEKFGEFGWDTSRFVHLANFAPADPIPVRRRTDPGRFLYAGRLDPAKGVGTLIKAVGETPAVTLDIAGDGPLDTELRALADSRAPGRVTFHGRVGPEELAGLRDASLATVVPSECYENSPYSATEAFLRGCPVIASRTGGLPELVEHGQTGLLFTMGDQHDLSSALVRLTADRVLQERISRGARSAAQRLGIHEYVPRVLEVYGTAIAQPSPLEVTTT